MGYWSHQFSELDVSQDTSGLPNGADGYSLAPLSVVGRRQIVPQAAGDVLEIGIGSGANLGLYKPGQVSRITGVDPRADLAAIQEKTERYGIPVTVMQRSIEAVGLEDAQFDCVVSTNTLCAVGAPDLVLDEIQRLLKPGGVLLFSERGRHPRGDIARMQDFFSPLWSRVASGCQLNRNMFRLIEQAGFKIEFLETGSEPFKPSVIGYVYAGCAIKV